MEVTNFLIYSARPSWKSDSLSSLVVNWSISEFSSARDSAACCLMSCDLANRQKCNICATNNLYLAVCWSNVGFICYGRNVPVFHVNRRERNKMMKNVEGMWVLSVTAAKPAMYQFFMLMKEKGIKNEKKIEKCLNGVYGFPLCGWKLWEGSYKIAFV